MHCLLRRGATTRPGLRTAVRSAVRPAGRRSTSPPTATAARSCRWRMSTAPRPRTSTMSARRRRRPAGRRRPRAPGRGLPPLPQDRHPGLRGRGPDRWGADPRPVRGAAARAVVRAALLRRHAGRRDDLVRLRPRVPAVRGGAGVRHPSGALLQADGVFYRGRGGGVGRYSLSNRATSARSASTISRARSRAWVCASQPSSAFALLASPRSASTSEGRSKLSLCLT